jgi:aerobic-type carbon monoxide dehydrogenase small subunit (CoxS/CutS family)
MNQSLSFTLNGKPVSLDVDPERKLLWVLRTDLGLTGTKYGCGESLCGSCTVVVNCQLPMAEVAGKTVLTIEGLATGDRLHPLQEVFAEHGAFQCGYCTPGMIMGAYALLQQRPRPTRAQIVEEMEPHLCRCSAYKRIIEAIEIASRRA